MISFALLFVACLMTGFWFLGKLGIAPPLIIPVVTALVACLLAVNALT